MLASSAAVSVSFIYDSSRYLYRIISVKGTKVNCVFTQDEAVVDVGQLRCCVRVLFFGFLVQPLPHHQRRRHQGKLRVQVEPRTSLVILRHQLLCVIMACNFVGHNETHINTSQLCILAESILQTYYAFYYG